VYTKEEIEEAGLDRFVVFLAEVWAYLRLPAPTPVQQDIAHQLQYGPKHLIIQAFRGVGKSWITAAFVLWILFTDPQKKILVVSANQQLADNFSIFCKQLISDMPLLQHLSNERGDRWSNVSFDVAGAEPDPAPSVKSAGITGQITGSRADIIIGDDIEVPKNSFTHQLRERIAELVKEFASILKPKPEARTIYLGTPQVEMTLYGRLARSGYTIMVWPARIPAMIDHYHGRLAPYVLKLIAKGAQAGDPVEPQRFDHADLTERELSMGRSAFALQFMLDTTPGDAEKHPLKLHDLIVASCGEEMTPVKWEWSSDREQVIQDLMAGGFEGDFFSKAQWKSDEMTKYGGTVMAIDPSGRGSDETGYAIIRYAHGKLYLVACGGFIDGYGEATLEQLAGLAVRYRVNDIICEDNYGGGMFSALLKPVLIRTANALRQGIETAGEKWWAPRILDKEDYNTWSSGQKETRILNTLEPVVKNHKLIVDRRVIEKDIEVQADKQQYSLVYQMTRMERLKGALAHDDRIEAVAMACAFWTERMSRDEDKALEQVKSEIKDKALRRFVRVARATLGNAVSPNAGTRRYLRYGLRK
jgi:hypothetical protein